MRKTFLILLLVLALALVACGGGGEEATDSSAGSVSRGETLFNQATIGSASAPGCVTCHSLEEGMVIVGPSQYGLATRAGGRVAGQSAENYLRQSIVEPNAYVVEGFNSGVMYPTYGEELSDQDIKDLVAYMLTLTD